MSHNEPPSDHKPRMDKENISPSARPKAYDAANARGKKNWYPMIFVGGLGVSTTADDLIEAFRAGGFSITVNPKIRKGNSFAYCPNVALANEEEVSRALVIGQIWVKDRFADVREYKNRDKNQNYPLTPSLPTREHKPSERPLTRVPSERTNRYSYPPSSPNYTHIPTSPRYSYTHPPHRDSRYAYESERYPGSYHYHAENQYLPPSPYDLHSQFAQMTIGGGPYHSSSPTNVPYINNGTTIYPAEPAHSVSHSYDEHIVPPGLASVPN